MSLLHRTSCGEAYNGADEVHRMLIAREAFDDIDPAEVGRISRFGS